MHARLAVEELSKLYYLDKKKKRELWALDDVSFSAAPGEILGVIGPNGAGKTTLLRILSRVTYPTRGRARGFGKVLPLLELDAAFQPQLTTRENIYLNATMRGIPAAEIDRQLDAIVAHSEIEEYLDEPLKGGPAGLDIRIAFSMILTIEPELILADEILAVCDPEFQDLAMRRIEEAAGQGSTVLYVSHNMAEVLRLSDRVLWLDKGKIVQLGEPEEVVSAYQNSAWSLDERQTDRELRGGPEEIGRILFARLNSPDGDVLRRLPAEEEAVVSVAFELSRPASDVRCFLDFHTPAHPAFRTASRDTRQARQPGVYLASARVPRDLLASTVYTVDVGVVVGSEDDTHTLQANRALSFQVYDRDRERPEHRALQAAVTPRLEWSLQERGEHVVT